MKTLLFVLLAVPTLLAGCGDGFPDEEMHLGLEDKTRPYAITLDPPEVAPGETVTVTLAYHAARPTAIDDGWRVALDFATGPYGNDQIERRIISLPDVSPAEVDQHGFATQTFQYTVPDSVLLWSTAIDDEITDPVMLAYVEALLGSPPGESVPKTDIDAWLRALTPEDLAAMDPATRAATLNLTDLFACSIRFRVSLETDVTVDVTRNLTVRHSSRLASPNTNGNPAIIRFAVGAVPAVDVDVSDLEEWEDRIEWYEFDETSPDGVPQARVPNQSGRTYLVRVRFDPETYTSPFEPDHPLEEQGEYRWYYYRLDAPGSGHVLFTDEEGEETEMYELDEDVRLAPPGGASNYRLVSVVRDLRGEWENYGATPGATVTVGEVVFEAP